MCDVVIGDMKLLSVAIWHGVMWVDVHGLCLGGMKRLALGSDVYASS